ncbi:hypothetical protein KKA00_03420 [bacterium]|nr:hypothetical protein [bacterium]MBU1651243.1 hypothetical protein [bacterium]MBU1880855.1 hypothetical protein [bacterium]
MKRISVIFGLTLILSAALIAFAITNDGEETVCPTCDMTIANLENAVEMKGETGSLHFCGQACFDKFKADPLVFMTAEEMETVGLCLDCAKSGGCEDCEDKAAAATPCGGCERPAETATPAGDVEPAETDGGCTGDCSDCDSHDK